MSRISKQNSFEMFAESVHCRLGVAKGNRKVVPRTRTGYCKWSVPVCKCVSWPVWKLANCELV